MQKYEVEIAPRALDDIRLAFNYIYKHSPQNAINWLRKLYLAIDKLETYPRGCGLIHENQEFDQLDFSWN